MRITIVGCGSKGSRLAKAADEMDEVKRIYVVDKDKGRAEKVANSLKKAIVVDSVEDELYHCDLVIESANQAAAKDILPKVVSRGVDIMIMSVGSLVDDDFRKAVFDKAVTSEAKIFLPSGGLCGLDALRAAVQNDVTSVELVTTKGPHALQDVEYLIAKGIDVNNTKEKVTVFSGLARDAVKNFPKNVNVAATVALMGIGFDRTKVTVVLDPKETGNSYDLQVAGVFGHFDAHTYNVPEPDNVRNSQLAVLSAIAALKRICRNEWFGV